jgi:hypothetical protein
MRVYPKVSGLSPNEIIIMMMMIIIIIIIIIINTRSEATQRCMEAELTKLTHKITILLL